MYLRKYGKRVNRRLQKKPRFTQTELVLDTTKF